VGAVIFCGHAFPLEGHNSTYRKFSWTWRTSPYKPCFLDALHQ